MNRSWRLLLAVSLGFLTSCTTVTRQIGQTPMQVSIIPVSGSNQSHAVKGMFAQALVATVSMNGIPMSGIVVKFVAPSFGPSATFSNTSSITATATSDEFGTVTSPSFVANGKVGTYTITATTDAIDTPGAFSLTNTAGGPASIVAASGSPQTTSIGAAFPSPLVAQVLDAGGNPVKSAVVTFTAPASGASGTFAGNVLTETHTTNASGLATSTTFTSNLTSGADVVTATVVGVTDPANFNLTNGAGAPANIVASQGTPQSAGIGTAFSVPLGASVLDAESNPVAGIPVTFTAPNSGATGTFVGGKSVVTTVTDATGLATAPTFTANGTLGSYTVTATSSAVSATATFSLTNRQPGNTYVFYLSGQDAYGPDFYALAGSVIIDPSGNILAGEQDYNSPSVGIVSPQPSGDTITGGTMVVNGTTGQGTLTLVTNNTSLGVNGVETLGVQFVNTNHAQIIEFDGTATSSGSLDTQTQGTLSGGFSFALGGLDNILGPVSFGGVFSIAGTTIQSGTVDENDDGTLATGTSLSGTISAPDSLGRGTLTTNLNYLVQPLGSPIALNYYIVGPEVIRIIGVDPSDSPMGSAFGQGSSAGSFTNDSLKNSVFGLQGSPFLINYGTAGSIAPSSGSFTGVADNSETFYGAQSIATSIFGTYSIAGSGYGNLIIGQDGVPILNDVNILGIYMTDPKLNLSDPNNTSAGLGGALLIDMDGALPGGSGVVIPQTDTSTASFTGNYSFGAQSFYAGLGFDFVGQGSVTGGTLNGSGLLSDIFEVFNSTTTDSGVTFAGTPLADTGNPGRYTFSSSNPSPNPLNMTVNGNATPFDVALYQASGGQLLWMNEDPTFTSVFFGSMQQQGSLAGIPGSTSGSSETISATSGTPQSANVNTAFALPLVATVTTGGIPQNGVTVTFSAPSSGASGTFTGGLTTATATTNSSGIATSPTFTANASAGPYTVTATATGASAAADFSLTNTSSAQEVITATGGTPQSAAINTAFASPLVATVTTGGVGTSGVVVTFTAPGSGASGTFTGGVTTVDVTTDTNGNATAPTLTANASTGSYTVTATAPGISTPAGFSLTNTSSASEVITATGGTPQSATVNTAFALPLDATVTTNGNPTSGVLVTFTAPSSGASGTFTGGSTTAQATTNASGIATSPTFTANATVGSYTVTATATGATGPANFSLTNNSVSNTKTYVFSLSGLDTLGPDFYALVGAVTFDSSGNVLGGEQDYNAAPYGLMSPQPSGDTITSGTLTVNSTTGQGTLVLHTNNINLGVGGVETLGIQFVNSNHAQVIEFDGIATSSGTMDLQVLPSELSGGYAFIMDGVDNNDYPTNLGGVFSISGGTTLQDGFVDMNDGGTVTTGTALSGTVASFDSYGRGSITSTLNYAGSPVTLNYYIVGPEAVRLIDVDTTDSAAGSAFGQGTNATAASNSSLGTSVFTLNGSPYPEIYDAAGMFSTNTTTNPATISGILDDNEVIYGILVQADLITGTYSIASNGYGSLTIDTSGLGDIAQLGIYMTDLNLNLLDPNNTSSGLGGGLFSDMDSPLPGGTGIVVPQTDTSKTSFTGKYTLGAQGLFAGFAEFDLIGVGTVNSGALSATGLISDPYSYFGSSSTLSSVPLTGTPLADTGNPGRYTMSATNSTPNPLKIKVGSTNFPFELAIYQASGGLLFWLDEDAADNWNGSLQQLGSLSGIPGAKKNGVIIMKKPDNAASKNATPAKGVALVRENKAR
ncbi:MAG TPA: hypothetical protein VMP68_31220 [Candidatus Eisenbacteria bacterium]|nr:hypothetical protein [Candidatus Eisenbacteria bacterium]